MNGNELIPMESAPPKPLQQYPLVLRSLYTDGLAYATRGPEGQEVRYIRLQDGGVYEITSKNMDTYAHPMMYQDCQPNPMAEIGREFRTPEELDAYADALTTVDSMITFAGFLRDTEEEKDRKEIMAVVEKQKRKAHRLLPVLDTVEGFDCQRRYLKLPPEEIYWAAQEDRKAEG